MISIASTAARPGVQFKVATDVFSGPLDLLLFLVKRQEVDVTAVPIARIASDFVAVSSSLGQATRVVVATHLRDLAGPRPAGDQLADFDDFRIGHGRCSYCSADRVTRWA